MLNFVQQFDHEPQFWQFISSLDFDDIIVELIQNELDAGASHTHIDFQSDRLVCRGDGNKVDKSGWQRLAYVMGAGDKVERKRFRIGVKNHGLKACFRLGDEIVLRSDGRRIVQTLYKDGYDSPPSPGTYPDPVPDHEAPKTGCSVEIPYRRKELVSEKGERLVLPTAHPSFVEELFRDACEQLPERLMGTVRPSIRPDYTISLKHFELGTVLIHWRARRPKLVGRGNRKQFTLFSRVCTVASDISDVPSNTVHEWAATFKIRFPSGTRQEIPEFFVLDKRHFAVEVAWSADRNGRPIASTGARRYPISYSSTLQSALTSTGVHFSGPYVSDAQRHGASQMGELNELIDDACKDGLVEVMASHLLQRRHGGKAMELYMNNRLNPDTDALDDLVSRTIQKRALPLEHKKVLPSKRSAQASPRYGRRRTRRTPLGPRRTTADEMQRVVLPMFTWDCDQISPLLADICPASVDQIDKRVPGPILQLLKTDTNTTITFDENDAIERLQPDGVIRYFPWEDESEWGKALGDPSIVRKYLDVVYRTIRESGLDSEQEIAENAYLSDEDSKARPLRAMHSAVNLPPSLSSQQHVPIIHSKLRSHPLLRRRAWKPRPFRMDDFLEMANLGEASLEDRRTFWNWLRRNGRKVNDRQLHRIRLLPVWPSHRNCLLPFDDLCEPRVRNVATILGDAIERPSSEISRSGLANKKGTGRLKFRDTPNEDEVEYFLWTRLDEFPEDRSLPPTERRAFNKFESDVAALSSNPRLKKILSELSDGYAVALAGDATLQSPGELVRNENDITLIHLPLRHTIDRPEAKLDRIKGWEPRRYPSTNQIVDALLEDRERYEAHIPRLICYVHQAEKEGIATDEIQDVPCIPIEGELFSPSQLALRGGQNYWGGWKKEIPVSSINPEVQKLYRKVGVVGGRPTTTLESLGFFRWLFPRGSEVIGRHIDQILRHIGHRNGPTIWSDMFPRIPFIPAEVGDGEIRLFTIAESTRGRGRVVVPDSASIADAIREKGGTWPVYLAVLASTSVTQPITTTLRNMGLKSLSERAGDAEQVTGSGNSGYPDFDFQQILDSLRTGRRGQQLRKRLDNLGLDANRDKLKSRWRSHLDDIKEVRRADSIVATYKLARRKYDVLVDGELDRTSGTLWLKSTSDLQETFFYVLAEIVFEDPKRFHGLVLNSAFWMDMKERLPLEYTPEDQPSDEDDENNELPDATDDLVATEGRHPKPNTDPSKNLPSPGPIPEVSPPASSRIGRNYRSSTSTRTQSRSENAQIEDLKNNQYAWHCQVCLSETDPSVLAPRSSYVEGDHNRRRLIEAQHCDHVNARGARHAGNILIMCKFHHDALGDAFGRVEVVQSLNESRDRSLTFRTTDGRQNVIQGKMVAINPPQRQESISLFFTTQHMEYWLKKASEEGIE